MLESEIEGYKNAIIESIEVIFPIISHANRISILDDYFVLSTANLLVAIASTTSRNSENAIALSSNSPYPSAIELNKVYESSYIIGSPLVYISASMMRHNKSLSAYIYLIGSLSSNN